MRILTNIAAIADAKNTFSTIGVEFAYVKDYVFNLTTYNPDIVITGQNAQKVAAEFPSTVFIYPEATFPSYPLIPPSELTGYDSIEAINIPTLKHPKFKICFLNTRGVESKLLVQRLKSQYPYIHIYGHGFGIHGITKKVRSTYEIYRNYEACASDDIKENIKIEAYGKLNYLKNPADPIDPSKKTYFDIMAKVLNEYRPDLSEQLLQKKEQIHAKN